VETVRNFVVEYMSNQPHQSVLRNKAVFSYERQASKDVILAKTFVLAPLKATDQIFGISVAAGDADHQLQQMDTLPAALSENHLLVLLEGPEDCRGLLALVSRVLAAFIEVLTIGTLRKRTAVNRMPTATDSALMAAVIDAVLTELTSALSAELDTWWARGFRYLSPVEDCQSLGTALPAQQYQMLACSIDISDGAKQSQVLLPFPERSVPSELAPSLPYTDTEPM
jgi:flagellar motor switch protein FliM